jgi:hypothetical protein
MANTNSKMKKADPEPEPVTTLAVAGVEVLTKRPDDLVAGDVSGTEGISRDDMLMPRLALAQGLSPQLRPGDPKYIQGLSQGQVFNNVTGTNYGTGPWHIVVVRRDPPRGIEFHPREKGGGIKDISVPLNDPRMQFTKDADGKSIPPVATKFYDFYVVLLDSGKPLRDCELVALSFKGSGLLTARLLNTLIKQRGAFPLYAGVYSLSSVMTTNQKGTFATFKVDNAGWLNAADRECARDIFESIKDRTITVEREEVTEAEVVGPDDPGAESEM